MSAAGSRSAEAGVLYVMDLIDGQGWGFRVRLITPDGTVSTLAVVPE